MPVLTSLLTYAEIHATLAGRLKEQLLCVAEYHPATTRFDSAWRTYPSAQWAAYAVQTGKTTRPTSEVVFCDFG